MHLQAMRKRSVAIFLLLAAAMPLQLTAAPQHKRAAREQIIELEQQWRQAELDVNIPAMDKLLSDDYLGILGTGEVVTKAQQLDHMRTREMIITSLDISDIKVKLIGQIAIVNSLAKLEGSVNGHSMNGSFRYTRVYQRLPSGIWKITSFEATRILSGRRFAETPPPPDKGDSSEPK
jgi:ketosteroid isomerase-like protein